MTAATRPALVDVLSVVADARWWSSPAAWGTALRHNKPLVAARGVVLFEGGGGRVAPWLHPEPADALAALVEARLVAEHWLDAARAPRWWCEACEGVGQYQAHVWVHCEECDRRGNAQSPQRHVALVSVAALGPDALARAEAIVAETWPGARLVWRVVAAEAIEEHHASMRATRERSVALGRPATLPEAFGAGHRLGWDVVAAIAWRRDSEARRAWPALRALAAVGLHLLACDAGRVVLGCEAAGADDAGRREAAA